MPNFLSLALGAAATAGGSPAAFPPAPASANAPILVARSRDEDFTGDTVEGLPEVAREKLLTLREEADLAHEGVTALIDRQQDARLDLQKAQSRFRKLLAIRPALAADHTALVEAERVVEAAKSEFHRIERLLSLRSPTAAALRGIVSALERYAGRHSGHGLALAPPTPVPTLRKGQSHAQAVDDLRDRLRSTKASIRAVLGAPLPSRMAIGLAHRQIDELAARGRPNVESLLYGAGTFEFAKQFGGQVLAGSDEPHIVNLPQVFDGEATACWAFGDHLKKILAREIEAKADDARALTPEQREVRVRELKAELLSIERQEEALITAATNERIVIYRRPDSDPRAVLSLADNCPEPVT